MLFASGDQVRRAPTGYGHRVADALLDDVAEGLRDAGHEAGP